MKVQNGLVFILAASLALPAALPTSATGHATLPPRVRAVLNSISASELEGDLSFLASDTLEGRYTPSPGLEVAAEFIASKFRASGLQAGGDHDYFQTAAMIDRHLRKPSDITIETGSKTIHVPPDSIQIRRAGDAASIERVPAIVFTSPDVDALMRVNLTGKAVIVRSPDFEKLSHDKAMAEYGKLRSFGQAVESSKAAIEIVASQSELRVPDSSLIPAEDAERREVPVLLISNSELWESIQNSEAGASRNEFISVNLPAPDDRKVAVKNVIGILRGSDPQLGNTYVLLTAHYDHIGTLETGKGMAMPAKKETTDRIYNGANDDGSGTVSVIEIARALAQLNPHPRRSVVFMTFFGEERGELGSAYYAARPVFPLTKTVADVNLEQVGRTDSTTGKQINTASLTGYDYSDVTAYLGMAGRMTGIKVYKDAQASDAYFTQSDNNPLAEHGIPAHSVTVAFDYPDYHGLGDEWQKIDYNNMARVDRMIALSILNIANSPKTPTWNAQNPKTAPFREAQQKLRGQ